jgi:hypothetical protein
MSSSYGLLWLLQCSHSALWYPSIVGVWGGVLLAKSDRDGRRLSTSGRLHAHNAVCHGFPDHSGTGSAIGASTFRQAVRGASVLLGCFPDAWGNVS